MKNRVSNEVKLGSQKHNGKITRSYTMDKIETLCNGKISNWSVDEALV